MRSVVNAILYVVVTECQWRMLPKEYPAWQSVYSYFSAFRENGTWQRAGRHKHPTAGSLDSQSVKTTQGPGIYGYGAGKKVNGRKRHILVDTLGLLMALLSLFSLVLASCGADNASSATVTPSPTVQHLAPKAKEVPVTLSKPVTLTKPTTPAPTTQVNWTDPSTMYATDTAIVRSAPNTDGTILTSYAPPPL